jgi:asparagine synthase (glutamine-hydrolysing)
MTDRIAHRGPDGEGIWSDECIGLGHRRLAILDLSEKAQQPMTSTDGRFVLSYNGEVYNFTDLRRELLGEGYLFQSQSDSEVVLASLARWGSGALTRFNGMFALALWDRRERRLLLARDRYGIKPLYYASLAQSILFASEQKAIMVHPEFRSTVNKSALYEYFTFQNIFTDQTLLEGIRLLPAGHFATCSIHEPALRVVQYWDYRFREPEVAGDLHEYVEELDRLFHVAVTNQLVSDVEVGAYLSGGIDSGAITAVAARQIPNLKTFTCGFDLSSASGIELAFDERAKAEALSARFKTEHYEMVLKAGDMERALPRLAWHLEEPRVGQSYPNYYAAQLASAFVKVILSGCGGDELFGGYPWRYFRMARSATFEEYIDQYYLYWQRLVDNRTLQALFSPIWRDVQHVWTRDIFQSVFATHDNALDRPEDFINHSMYFEAKTFLHGLFVVEDKLSMSHGLEMRVPFMDNALVEFAMQCPVSTKIRFPAEQQRVNENDVHDKWSRTVVPSSEGKQLLRAMLARHVSPEISQATKQGFSSPDASWFKGESMQFVRRTLLNGDALIYNLLDRTLVHSLVNEHLSGLRNRRLLIWSLLNVETWLATVI